MLSCSQLLCRYLAPHQLHVTLILVSLAQSIHPQTPPDVLVPIVRKLSDAFVHPGVGPEVIAAGLNTIREICSRQPLVMEGQNDLLEDLVGYRKSKDKGVCAAARGILALYREVNPELLRKRERGKTATMAAIAGKPLATAAQFGHDPDEVRGIQGLDLLAKHFEEHGEEDGDEDKGWEGWDVEDASDSDSDDSGGWIDVSSDEDGGIDISDSEDEGKEGDDDGPKLSTKEKAAQWKAKRKEKRARAKAGASAPEEEEDPEAAKAKREEAKKEAERLAEQVKAEEEAMNHIATTRVSSAYPALHRASTDSSLSYRS